MESGEAPDAAPEDVLVVQVRPYRDRQDVVAQARAMVEACRRRGLHRVLADTSPLGDRIEILDRILVGRQVPAFWPDDIRLALWCSPIQMLPTMPFEHAASAHGTPVRVFTDRAEALRWLRADR